MSKYFSFTRALFVLAVFTTYSSAQSGGSAVPTGQYNTARTSTDLAETILSPSNVNVNQFGKLSSWSVDGWVFAQPLYAPGVSINGSTKNVVYVATMHNSVYAFDADNPGAAALWSVNFGPSVTAPTSNGCPASAYTGPELGILGTPVIDQTTNTLYAVSAAPSGGGYTHYLHAIDLTTKQEKFGGPVQIQPSVPGNGYDAQNGKVTLGPASAAVQRSALLLSNGTVYAAFGDCGPDQDPWHGWLVAYNAASIQNQTFVFNTTPNGGQGGIWQSGRGPVADPSGDIYFNTGNATVYNTKDANVTSGSSTNDAAQSNYAERFVQLTSGGQFLASYPPANYSSMNNNDLDFSSSGPLLIPGTNLFVTGGKDGVIYLFNSNNMATPVQSFQATGTSSCTYSMDGCDQIHDLAFWNNTLYVWGSNDYLRAYAFNPSNNQFVTSPSSHNSVTTGYHPASLAVSANSTQSSSGIVWAITPNSILHAFNAANVASELWNSTQNSGRDALPSYPKFTEATVANGRVYVATHSNQLAVYGLLSDFTLASSAGSVSAYQGGSTSFNVDVSSLGSSSGPVALSVSSGLPQGATATFNPTSITGSGSSVVTITTASSTPTGTYNLLVSGTRAGETRTASVSLQVTTPDTTPPDWTCCTYSYSGSNTVLTFTTWDTQSGLKSIQPVQVVDATVSIPPFTVGTNNVVSFTATESGWSSYVKFQVTDVAGNTTYVDPIFVDPERKPGRPVSYGVRNVTPQEGVITVQNGSPGLVNVLIAIDGGLNIGHVQIAGLRNGETRVINIGSLLKSSGSTVTITPLGLPGGTAMFVFANVPMTGTH